MNLLDTILIHRYLYYVLNQPIISDFEYDILEKEAKKIYPELNTPGSSLEESYSDEIRIKATKLLNDGDSNSTL